MRVRKSAENRKAEILQAALALAYEVGPNQVSTTMISDRCGLTQPALYKHFRNKDEIWQAATNHLCDRIAKNIATAKQPDTPPKDHLRQLILGHLQLVQDTPALPAFMVAHDPKGAQGFERSQVQTSMSDFFQAMVGAIEDGRRERCFRADIGTHDIATLLFGVIQSLVLRLLVTRDSSKLLSDGARLVDLQMSVFEWREENK